MQEAEIFVPVLIKAAGAFPVQTDMMPVENWRRRGHEEFLPFAHGSLDLVLSLLTLHSVNDLPGSLIQIRRRARSRCSRT